MYTNYDDNDNSKNHHPHQHQHQKYTQLNLIAIYPGKQGPQSVGAPQGIGCRDVGSGRK